MPTTTGTRSSRGSNSAAVGGRRSNFGRRPPTSARSMPVIAATRADRRSCSARWPRTPALAGRPRPPSTTRQAIAVAAAETSRTGFGSVSSPAAKAPKAMHGVHAAQQPAVAEPDLAPSGGEPAEGHPADRPLQQHRGGLEADHAAEGTVASRRRRPSLAPRMNDRRPICATGSAAWLGRSPRVRRRRRDVRLLHRRTPDARRRADHRLAGRRRRHRPGRLARRRRVHRRLRRRHDVRQPDDAGAGVAVGHRAGAR